MVSRNSSITRVRPVFQRLISEDNTGQSWLPKILKLASLQKSYADSLAMDTGRLLPWVGERHRFDDKVLKARGVSELVLEQCFEHDIEPPRGFLRWLITNTDRLTWLNKGREKCSAKTQKMREDLFGYNGQSASIKAKQEALSELERVGPKGSWKRWWAFEGFTSADCYLETDRLALIIEGKRLEKASSKVEWYPTRNQLIRNLEVTSQAATGKQFALLAIGEETIEDPDMDTWISSLPHLTDVQRYDLQGHYLGHTTWDVVCRATGISHPQLPDTVDGAICELQQFGYISI